MFAPAEKWTLDEDDKLRELRLVKKMSIQAIANAMGRSKGSVKARSGRLNLNGPPSVKKPKPRTPPKPRIIRNEWIVTQDDLLISLREAGAEWEAIAPAVGHTASACKARYFNLVGKGEGPQRKFSEKWVAPDDMKRAYKQAVNAPW